MSSNRFQWVGRIRKVRPGDHHVVGEVPGKVALVIDCEDESGEEMLGYFAETRRPTIGARVGARGHYVVMDVPDEQIPPEDRELLGSLGAGCQVQQHQLDVSDWQVVSDDFDRLFDGAPIPRRRGPGRPGPRRGGS